MKKVFLSLCLVKMGSSRSQELYLKLPCGGVPLLVRLQAAKLQACKLNKKGYRRRCLHISFEKYFRTLFIKHLWKTTSGCSISLIKLIQYIKVFFQILPITKTNRGKKLLFCSLPQMKAKKENSFHILFTVIYLLLVIHYFMSIC